MFILILTLSGVSELACTGREARNDKMEVFHFVFQVAGSLYWKLNNSDGSNVICYKVAVRILYGSKLLEVLHRKPISEAQESYRHAQTDRSLGESLRSASTHNHKKL